MPQASKIINDFKIEITVFMFCYKNIIKFIKSLKKNQNNKTIQDFFFNKIIYEIKLSSCFSKDFCNFNSA